jgi:hypothetical protein
MKTFILSAVVSALAASAVAGPVDTLALWTFEQSMPTNAGPHAAEFGIYGGDATGFHSSASTVYSNPVGNGSLESFSANNWNFDDYFQFTTSTVGYQEIMFGWSQTRSGTGPVDFAILWSADGVNFQSLFQYSVAQITWSSAVLNPASVYAPVALPPEAANLSTVWVRIFCEDAGAPAGTSRVDDVFFSGMAVPAPGILALMALAGVCGPRRRRA